VTGRRAAALALAAAALPALAYVLPVPGILRRMGERRAELGLASLEATGTLQAEGPAAERLAVAAGLRTASGRVALPARFAMKTPGRCRLELLLPDAVEAERPAASLRDGRLTGVRGLDAAPAIAALVRSTCALLAVPPVAGGSERAYAEALGRRGVALDDATLGRFGGRLAFVVGGRARDAKPLAFVDKQTFQPLRLLATDGGALLDTRLLDWGSPIGGDWFPRAVEVWDRDALRLRFTAEKVTANPKLPDAGF
jgi:hypothetical protein